MKQNHTKEVQILKENHTKEVEILKKDHNTEIDDLQQNITQLIQQLQNLEQNYTEQAEQLHVFEYRAEIYQNHLGLIETISGHIHDMDVCYWQLEKYCKLKEKGKSRSDVENGEMERLTNYLSCKNEISADYYWRIKDSFQKDIEIMLKLKKAQVVLLIEGNFTKMETEQKNANVAPAKTCSFICDLQMEETVKSTTETIFEIGWKIFKKFFY